MNSVMNILVGCLVFATVLVQVHCQTVKPDTVPDLEPLVSSFATCDTMNCPPNSFCRETSGDVAVYCECDHGKTGVNCTMDDPCLETKENCTKGMICYGPCNPNVFCEGATGIPHCTDCITGYKGKNCDEDEDECKEWEDACNFNGECVNTHGGYKCDCKAGYTGELCETCTLSETECYERALTGVSVDSPAVESAAGSAVENAAVSAVKSAAVESAAGSAVENAAVSAVKSAAVESAAVEGAVPSADASKPPGGAAESLHTVPVSMALALSLSIILSLLIS